MTDNKKTTEDNNGGKKPTRRKPAAKPQDAKTPAQDNAGQDKAAEQDNTRPEAEAEQNQEPQATPEPNSGAAASKMAGLSTAGKAAGNTNRNKKPASSGLKRIFQGAAVGVLGVGALLGKAVSAIGVRRAITWTVAAPVVLAAGSVLMDTPAQNIVSIPTGLNILQKSGENYRSMIEWGQGALSVVAAPFNAISSVPSGPVTDRLVVCYENPRSIANNNGEPLTVQQIETVSDNLNRLMQPYGYLYGMLYYNNHGSDYEAIESWKDGGYTRVRVDVRSLLDNRSPRLTVEDMQSPQRHGCPAGWVTQPYNMG